MHFPRILATGLARDVHFPNAALNGLALLAYMGFRVRAQELSSCCFRESFVSGAISRCNPGRLQKGMDVEGCMHIRLRDLHDFLHRLHLGEIGFRSSRSQNLLFPDIPVATLQPLGSQGFSFRVVVAIEVAVGEGCLRKEPLGSQRSSQWSAPVPCQGPRASGQRLKGLRGFRAEGFRGLGGVFGVWGLSAQPTLRGPAKLHARLNEGGSKEFFANTDRHNPKPATMFAASWARSGS